MNVNYFDKYVKYKNKYLILKNYNNKILKGGSLYISKDETMYINRFDTSDDIGKDIEKYLNPIYGLYMHESGFISNLFRLNKLELIDNICISNKEKDYIKKISKIINIICNNNGLNGPTIKITKYTPYDIGKYIALLYLCKDLIDDLNDEHISNIISNEKYNPFLVNLIYNRDKYNDNMKKDNINYINYINKQIEEINIDIKDVKIIKQNIKIGESDVNCFYLILFCLWCNMSDLKSLNEYYEGIQYIFKKYYPGYEDYIIVKNDNNDFEKYMITKFNSNSFKVLDYSYVKHFCNNNDKNNITYPDCGETTARNLINLICFKDEKFDQGILEQLGAIDILKEYYKKFNNFSLQTSNNEIDCSDMFGEGFILNAKDAWSRIIIFHANKNVTMYKNCNNEYNFEVNSGMSIDKNKINFLQLINNLLKEVVSFDNLNNKYDIDDIETSFDKNGYGNIKIYKKNFNNIIIHCNASHYYMEIENKKDENYNINIYQKDIHKQNIINILNINNDDDSFSIYCNYNSEKLENLIRSFREKNLDNNYNKYNINNSLKIIYNYHNYLLLSTINKYNSDFRSRIILSVNYNTSVIKNTILNYNTIKNFIVNISKKNKDILNEYTYVCDNFLFIKEYDITPKNFIINNNITTINMLDINTETDISLLPIINLTSIGDNFLIGCNKLDIINLSQLNNLTSIGNNFSNNCEKLIDVKLPNNLTSIGESFLNNCENLKEIDLSNLNNLTIIYNYFLSNCKNLIDVKLPIKLTSIEYGFLNNCENLKEIDLSNFNNLTSIKKNFLNNCVSLIKILLPINLTFIGYEFLYNCKNLIKIDLKNLNNLTSIEDNFLNNCVSLTEILLPINLTSIGNRFLYGCTSLIKIDFLELVNLTSLKDDFLYSCKKLTGIKLPYNITSIGNNFLNQCINLIEIDLKLLANLTSMGDNFINNYIRLQAIILNPSMNKNIIDMIELKFKNRRVNILYK